GQIIFAAYRVLFHCNDTLEAELHALMPGMALAIQHSVHPVVVQSDSSEALASLSSNALTRSAYGHLVLEIKELMSNRE
uniref:RNase H type-1 domain-containing protein n=1 Tax=Aegilops tauschii subsp. strangulata TaxID=200361 RepID=A0A453J2B4_AEGTS